MSDAVSINSGKYDLVNSGQINEDDPVNSGQNTEEKHFEDIEKLRCDQFAANEQVLRVTNIVECFDAGDSGSDVLENDVIVENNDGIDQNDDEVDQQVEEVDQQNHDIGVPVADHDGSHAKSADREFDICTSRRVKTLTWLLCKRLP